MSLQWRLYDEELAEQLGMTPATLDGCVAVLQVAARILEQLDA